MAVKGTYVTTDEWVEVAAAPALITVLKRGRGTLWVNEVADDGTSSRFHSELGVNEQIQQFSSVPLFIKHTGSLWVLLIVAEGITPLQMTDEFGDMFDEFGPMVI